MNYFSAKEKFVSSYPIKIRSQLYSAVENIISKGSDSSLLGRGMQRCLNLELCYIMLKYKKWSISECLYEVTIDFLNSEYRIPRKMATELVDVCLDIVQQTETIAHFKSPEHVDHDFLMNLFIETTIARDESKLEISLGFGRNLIDIIENATIGVDEREKDFEYSANIKTIMTGIIQDIIEKIQLKPWIIDLYRLRNILFSEANVESSQLDEELIESYFNILNFISYSGVTRKSLSKLFKCEASEQKAIDTLVKAKLVYIEPKAKSENDLIQLSKIGIETTAEYFANGFKKANATDFSSLTKLPSLFQEATLISISNSHIEQQESLLRNHGTQLAPEALKVLAKNLKNNIKTDIIIDLLWDIYDYDDSTFFIRTAIIDIMGSFTDCQDVLLKVKSIAKDSASSRLVSSRAIKVLEKAQSF